jgi:hypothetical protein
LQQIEGQKLSHPLPEACVLFLPPAFPQAIAKIRLATEMRTAGGYYMIFVHTKFGKNGGKSGLSRALQMELQGRYARLTVIAKR